MTGIVDRCVRCTQPESVQWWESCQNSIHDDFSLLVVREAVKSDMADELEGLLLSADDGD